MEKNTDFPVTVSILTPARNAAGVLERAVRSVQAQTFVDWEMIIVNDGSGDDTAQCARALAAKEPRVHVFDHAAGQGAAAARNTGLAHARGRYIAFLDADDAWAPEKLAHQVEAMKDAKAGLSYTGFVRISDKSSHIVEIPAQVTRSELLRGNCICCSSAMYDRTILGSVSMPDLKMRQDYALWLTVLGKIPHAVGVPLSLVHLHVTAGSLSSNKLQAMRATWQMHHGYFGVGALRAAFYVMSHTLRRLLRG